MAKEDDETTLQDILYEIREQPPYRSQADKEMDYCDGNQHDTETLNAMRDKGIPSITENLLGPVFKDQSGLERKNRTDWRVDADSDDDEEGEAVAKALSYKLYQAEKRSGAEKAFTEVYNPLSKVGIGWIEVSRQSDPFEYPYRVQHIHRNEMWRDWYAKNSDLTDARWCLRRKWVATSMAEAMMPKYKALIRGVGSGWENIDALSQIAEDTGSSTNLMQSLDIQRGWSIEEQQYRDPSGKRICLFNLLTRNFEQALVLTLPNGRVVEFDETDISHVMAVMKGGTLEKRMISRIKDTLYLGPHVLQSKQSELKRFKFVQFVGDVEDRTGIPYGGARWLMPLQDEVNARVSKMVWRLSATRTIRTKGAVIASDAIFRQMIGRQDADIVLDPVSMGKPGAKFEIDNNFDLNTQQYNRLLDLRTTIAHISGVSAAFSGDAKPDNAGALSQAIEQSAQSQASTNDAHAYGRTQVGEILLDMIIRDMGKAQQVVTIKGDALRGKEVITLNAPTTDPETGHEYLTNDVQRTMLKVALDDVPSTTHFKQQQLAAMTEFGKSLPAQYQAVLMPYLVDLANIPNKKDVIKAIKDISTNNLLTEDQVVQRVKDEVDKAKIQWMVDQKNRDLDLKEKKITADIDLIVSEKVNKAITSIYSATQAALQITAVPGVAPSADQILKSAGFQDQDLPPIVASPVSSIVAAPAPAVETGGQTPGQPVVHKNTSPAFPPVAPTPKIEPQTTPDMVPMHTADTGMDAGIEKQGVQL